MKIKTQPLSEALKRLSAITATSKAAEGRVRLRANAGFLSITAIGMDETCEELIEYESSEPFTQCLVNVNRFASALMYVGEQIELIESETEIIVKSEFDSTKLPLTSAEHFPEAANTFLKSLPLAASEFADGLSATAFCASKASAGRPELECAHVVATGAGVMFETSNGRSAAIYEMNHETSLDHDFKLEFCVPRDFCDRVISSCARTDAHVQIGATSIVVQHQNGFYRCKLIENKFPNFQDAFKDPERRCDYLLGEIPRVPALNLFAKAASFRDKRDFKPCKVNFGPTGFHVSTDEYNGRIDGQFAIADISFNAVLIHDCLASFKSDKVKAEISKGKLIQLSHRGQTIIVMPLLG